MFASCYEDKGNYEYKKVMTFEVPNMNSSLKNRTATLGELYTAYPPVNFYNWTNPEDTLRLKYVWVRSGANNTIDTLCEGRIFQWVPDVAGSAMGINVLVRDTLTGIVSVGSMQLTVASAVSTGWAFLHSYGGNTDMSFIYPINEQVQDPEFPDDPTKKITVRKYKSYPNFLSQSNPGVTVGTNPVKAIWYPGSKSTKILILQDNPVTVAGDTWKVEVNLADEFAGSMPVGGFKDMLTFESGFRLLLANSGRMYLDQTFTGSSFYASRFMGLPMTDIETTEELNVVEFSKFSDAWFGKFIWANDAENKRFIFLPTYDGTAFWPAPSKEEVEATANAFADDLSASRYIDIANYEGYNYLFSACRIGAMGTSDNGSGTRNSHIAFFFEKDGEVYIQHMLQSTTMSGYVDGLNDYIQYPLWKNIEVIKWSELTAESADPAVATIDANSPRAFVNGKSQSSNEKMDYMYFAKGNVVYCLDFETSRLYEYYKLPEGVEVKLLELNYHDTELGVYSSDNTFRTLKCASNQLYNTDYESKLIEEFPNITDVKQILYVRGNKSFYNMPATSGGYNDRIIWTE